MLQCEYAKPYKATKRRYVVLGLILKGNFLVGIERMGLSINIIVIGRFVEERKRFIDQTVDVVVKGSKWTIENGFGEQ